MGSRKGLSGYWWGKLSVTDHLENQGVDGRKILRKK
jgi:hypothetical protein